MDNGNTPGPSLGGGRPGAHSSLGGEQRENRTTPHQTQGDLVIIGALQKNSRETLRIALDRFMGVDLVDLRICVDLTESSHIKSPTKKGVSFRIAMLDDVIEALQEARAEAGRRGLLR